MSRTGIPFQVIDWTSIPKTEHAGENGLVFGKHNNCPGYALG